MIIQGKAEQCVVELEKIVDVPESKTIVCANAECRRVLQKAFIITHLSKKPTETYLACPHCLSRVETVCARARETDFPLLETPEFEEQPERLVEEAPELYPSLRRARMSNLAGLFLTSFGLIILAWVGWLTWSDMTVWSKDIALIFFGSRIGEAISLGIGMKVIDYFLLGLALLLLGLLAFLRRRQSRV